MVKLKGEASEYPLSVKKTSGLRGVVLTPAEARSED